MRPVIGITTRRRIAITADGETCTHTVLPTYVDAIQRVGAVPLLLAPVRSADVASVLGRIDGLVLTGGGDIDPVRYGSVRNDTMYDVDPQRDEFELRLVAEAADHRTPTLAVCRGLQVVNVAFGGTLIEDIPTQTGSTVHSVPGDGVYTGHQRVRFRSGSRVATVVGAGELDVNSIHHQAVRRLGDGLAAVGWAEDGIIEVIEHEDVDWPLLAVQWHPEFLAVTDDPPSLALFRALVESAGR